jgi:outer membrane protein OmpA-like peptidoglycan-associated protein
MCSSATPTSAWRSPRTSRAPPRRDLPKLRAESVKRYLVEHGIDAARLETRGAGSSEPIDTDKTRAGRARNRRIVFKILVK